MSERVDNERLEIWLDFANRGQGITVLEAQELMCDLLDSRARVKELERQLGGLVITEEACINFKNENDKLRLRVKELEEQVADLINQGCDLVAPQLRAGPPGGER